MAGEGGFAYEKQVYKKLKDAKVLPAGFVPAGADSNAPDAMFLHGGKQFKLELKLDLRADFGQGTLVYDLRSKKWILGGANTASAEDMRKFLTLLKVPELANQNWGKFGAPNKFAIANDSKFQKRFADFDQKTFKDVFKDITSEAVDKYYASKQTYYIQIKGFGFYRLAKDPAFLNVPHFSPKLKIRLRFKRGGSSPIYNYRFTTAIQIVGSVMKSPYDIDQSVAFLRG